MFRLPIAVETGEVRNVDGFIYTDLLFAPYRLANQQAPRDVDALGMTAHLSGVRMSATIGSGEGAANVTRPRIAVDADCREIDRLVKESARNSISIYDVFDDVIERLEPTQHSHPGPVRGLRGEFARCGSGVLARDEGSRSVSLAADSLAQIWRISGAWLRL